MLLQIWEVKLIKPCQGLFEAPSQSLLFLAAKSKDKNFLCKSSIKRPVYVVTWSQSRQNILNLGHYVIMLSRAFAIFIVYVVFKNSIYVMFYINIFRTV
jgi:hypothetical protein